MNRHIMVCLLCILLGCTALNDFKSPNDRRQHVGRMFSTRNSTEGQQQRNNLVEELHTIKEYEKHKLLSDKLIKEIASYKDIAEKIINVSVHGAAQNQSYNRLSEMVDKFGSRIAGSKALEDTIDYMLEKLQSEGLDNVHGEPVMVPHWVRGKESAEMLLPRRHTMSILGLGSSIGTGADGITADVLVVRSFDELRQSSQKVAGKIVVYNQPFVSYGTTVRYRSQGASEASKYGAVASLIRSVTPLSINSPHTGQQDYTGGVKKIPTACITVEDAEMMDRMQERGERIQVHLYMEAQNLDPVESRNTVAEITGSVYPQQVVLFSGHLDSWDVGQGAMDDGGGAFISWQVLSLIKQLGLKPKRTMRLLMWTAEEEGGVGGEAYYQRHKGDIKNYDLVMESDGGTFTPLGIYFNGNEAATEIMKQVVSHLDSINAGKLYPGEAEGTDINSWLAAGVPGASLANDNSKYFYFHHTNGDTMTVQDPGQMNLCSAVWAVTAFIVADLDDMLPK